MAPRSAEIGPRAALLSVFVCLLASGCASERLLARSREAPSWIVSTPGSDQEMFYFAGTALGDNVLDEPEMRSRAMADARAQIAERVASRVSTRAEQHIEQRGYAPSGENETAARYAREVQARASERLIGVSLQDTYWEKWRVDPGLFQHSYTRYKYYVLAAFPRQHYNRLINRYVRLYTDRAAARELMRDGRPREAARLLEKLLGDLPEESVSIRLLLAEAYEQAQMYGRAAEVLRAAAESDPGEAEAATIRERLERAEAAFPDLGGLAAEVRVRDSAGLEARRLAAWAEEAAAAANLTLDAPEADTRWIVHVSLKDLPLERGTAAYGVRIENAFVECSARVTEAGGRLLAMASAAERGYGRTRDEALRNAARKAVHAALRRCFLELAPTAE